MLHMKTIQELATVGRVIHNIITKFEITVWLVRGHKDVLQVVSTHGREREEYEWRKQPVAGREWHHGHAVRGDCEPCPVPSEHDSCGTSLKEHESERQLELDECEARTMQVRWNQLSR